MHCQRSENIWRIYFSPDSDAGGSVRIEREVEPENRRRTSGEEKWKQDSL